MTLVMTYPETMQEALDRVWRAFVTERRPRCTKQGVCAYRSDDAQNACGIGWLIPDDSITDPIGQSVLGYVESPNKQDNTQLDPLIAALPVAFLDGLQKAHDSDPVFLQKMGSSYAENMEQSLRALASDWSLTVPAPEPEGAAS